MRTIIFRASILASLLTAISLAGVVSSNSDAGRPKLKQTQNSAPHKRAGRKLLPLNHRSPRAAHKVLIPSDDKGLQQILSSRLARRARKFGAYTLLEVSDEAIARMDAATLERARLRDDFDLVMIKRGEIDTTGPEPQIAAELRQPASLPRSLHLVQLFGPPTPDSLRALKATGAKIISYVPNNAYLVWATTAQIERLHALLQSGELLQWDGPYHPAYKLDPAINLDSYGQVATSIQILDTPESSETIARIKSLSDQVLMDEYSAAGVVHIKVRAQSSKLKDVALMADVLAIEPWAEIHPMDERASQIAAGQLSTETVNNIQIARPTAPGYLAFLNSLGFNSDFDFAVDVGDTGLDQGSADAAKVHPDFLNTSGASRIAYLHDFSGDSHPTDPTVLPAHDTAGHGTLNASIIGGFNDKSGSAFADSLGFRFGLGVAPFVQVGASKVFDDDGDFTNATYATYISAAYRAGARISSNSWGACDDIFCNLYADDSAIFDSLVRDADPDTFGNQGMTIIFSAGNDGDRIAQSVSIPSTAKNVISVGASENFRSSDTDGCGVTGSEADNAQDIVGFSAGGPTQAGSAKPDLVAPGTHIQGAATQDKFFASKPTRELGVCNRFWPIGQTLYTWSSGTSHSAPIVAGGAALAFQWLRTQMGAEPSPALVKAFILNSTSYVTGRLGGDNLPGAHQGWGLLNLARMFEATDRIIYDQSPDRTFTQSGGAAFETTGVISDPSKEFRVMLVWTDPPGNAATNAPYVNQLNLEVVVGGVVYSGNNFQGQYSKRGGQADFVNNVQGVRLPTGTTGPFVVRVKPTIIAGDGVPGNGIDLDQDFALVVTNGRETAVPVLAVQPNGDVSQGVTVLHSDGKSDASVIPGETAKISVTVSNLSQSAAATINAAILLITSNGRTDGQGNNSLSVVQPGGTATNSVPFEIPIPSSLRCGSVAQMDLQLDTTVGRFTLPVRVQVGRADGATVELLNDDVDSASVKWKLKKFDRNSATANSGAQSYHTVDPGKEDKDNLQATLLLKKPLSIPENAGHVRLSFFHIFNFEPGYDGGVLEISDDGGETWKDAGALIITGGYDGKVTEASSNPLGTRFAWTARGRAGVFSQVVVNLDDYAGKRIKLRFIAGFDNAAGILDGYSGWYIDDIRITATMYACR
ncbi:MAG TPA: S8 family serine peptidase [Blastocatellia bacterium]|nr:S8 family serine peptidase [Blastocatellia bacterium]